MSASKEKRDRAGLRETGSYKKLNEQTEQERKEKKRKTKTWIIAVCVIVVVAIVILFGSNILYKNAAAIKAGGEKYTAADYNYYYMALYQNYYSYYSTYYADYGEPESFIPDEETMRAETLDIMQRIAALNAEADKAGYVLSEDGAASIDTQIGYIEYYSSSYGFDSIDSYLAANYGRGVTEKLFREDMAKWVRSEEYTDFVKESYGYTDEELDAYYGEHSDEYDVMTFRTFYFSGAATEADEENNVEAIDAETAMADALKNAEDFIARLDAGEKFADVARDLAPEASKSFYEDDASTLVEYSKSSMSEAYADWVCDSARTEGEHQYFENKLEDAGQGYYVVEFVSRYDNSYLLTNARHILVKPETVNQDDFEDDAAYQEAVELARQAAEVEAQDIYDEWLAGDATEESFAALADEKSDDTSEGGLIEDIYKGRTVTEFNDWCFDESRKAGDTEIIFSESYGYHIMYFIGYSEPYNRYIARSAYTDETYTAWETELFAGYEVKETGMMGIADFFNVTK